MININQSAQLLFRNRQTHSVVDNIPEALYPESIDEAYLVQARLVSLLLNQNNSTSCGYKLACTNSRVMKLLGVNGPLSGRMLSHSTHKSGASLNTEEFFRRIVELEFAFIMEKDVPTTPEPYTASSITSYIESFIPAIEIVDHHYTDFTKVGANALIADNAIHGAIVLGNPVPEWQSTDLSEYQVQLFVNNNLFSQGIGKNVLGSPLNVMAWLANHLQSRGIGLKSGDLVSTGTACEIYEAEKGDKVLADFGELGSVSASFV